MEKFNSASALFFGVLLLLSLFGCNAPEDRLHESWSLYENGDKEQHLKILHELADQDYPPALYSLGIHYGDWIDGFYGGQSAIVEIDIPRSIDLHLKALDLGYVDSAYPAMELLSTFGDPINRNWEKIVELRKAEVDHYPSSLARLYRDGFVVERNLDESINLFRKSANQGTIEHQLALFELLAGDKLEPARKEKVEALKWLSVLKNRLSEGRALEIYWPNNIENNMSESELAEARNLSESLFSEISWNWQNRHGFSQHLQNWPAPSPAKIESTISTLENYARQGNPNAQYLLSAVITSGGINAGFFFAKNPSEQALYWLKEAASQDYP